MRAPGERVNLSGSVGSNPTLSAESKTTRRLMGGFTLALKFKVACLFRDRLALNCYQE
jgi:hypothetical protein